MEETRPPGDKEIKADQIYRNATILRNKGVGNQYLNYWISVQLPDGQYDLALASLKKLGGEVSEVFTPKEWRFKGVSYFENDDADGQDSNKKALQKKLKGVDLTIEDISRYYYHRALLAGLK